MDDPGCEGLGPLSDRVLLDRRVPAFQHAPCTWIQPSLVFSARAAAAARSSARGADARAVPSGTVAAPGAALVVLEGTPGGRLGGDGWDAALADRAAAAASVEFDAEEREVPGPAGPIAVADAWVFDVSHWQGLLWANLLALGPHLWASLVGSPWRLALASARAASTDPAEVGAVLTRREPGARVHRAAVVEGSWLGRGASVGAGAVVRGAVLGEGAVVEELAIVEGCVLGPGARVQRQAMAKFSLVEDDAAVAGVVQLGVVGRGAQVKQGAVLMGRAWATRCASASAGSSCRRSEG